MSTRAQARGYNEDDRPLRERGESRPSFSLLFHYQDSMTALPSDVIYARKEGLVKALQRYGYTRIIPLSLPWLHAQHSACMHMKPYQITIESGALLILHENCACQPFNHAHSERFVKDMIPIIGNLDAAASYEDGEIPDFEGFYSTPRLRIDVMGGR